MELKTKIGLILLACVLLTGMILTSGTTQQQGVITVKPTIPKYTITQSFYSGYYVQDDMQEFIRVNIRKGYVVKSVSLDDMRGIVVMEKY